MKRIKSTSFIFISMLLLFAGCFAIDDISDTPRISFSDLTFTNNGPGSEFLSLTIDFQDGDGNIGLGKDELSFPYHPYDVIVDSDGELVTISKVVKLPFYAQSPNNTSRLFSNFDNRSTFNCLEYELLEINLNTNGATTRKDTVFIIRNENNKNIFVEYYRKRGGSYQFIDWIRITSAEACGISFDSRFPVFDSESIGKPLQGSITYKMISSGIDDVIRSDTFRLKVRIKDRALNESNTITTPDFTLNEIFVN
jgi:hypothetical protein